jgi:hypothetical protein
VLVGVGYTDLDLPHRHRSRKWSRNIRIKAIQMWKSFCEFVVALNEVGQIPVFEVFEATDQ